jgi:hypothetical protein
MVRRMYDAILPLTIPEGTPPPDYAMGYTNGTWPSYVGMKVRFPNAIPVSISAIPGALNETDAMGCDGEKGDYDPPQAADFSRRKLAQGVVPFEYCSLSDWGAYQQALIDIRIDPSHVDWLIAAYPGNGPNLYPGSIGHQYVDRGTYDESVIVEGWVPGRPVFVPATQEELIMGLPTGCTDIGAINAQIRDWYNQYSVSPMTTDLQNLFRTFYQLPATSVLWGKPGYGGNPDLLLAGIVDYIQSQGHTRPDRAGSV